MEDGGEGSSQSRHTSMFTYISDGLGSVKIAKDLVEPLFKSESLKEKINRLKRKSDALIAREEDVVEELEYAKALWLKRPKREVECWLEHVGHIKDGVRKAEQEVQETHRNWFPNSRLPATLDRLMTEAEDLHRKGEFSQGLTLEVQESRGVTFPTTRLFGQQFEANKTLIMESLMDSDVLLVGIYGMGGVGKTTLLTHINNELVRTCQITSVAWVTVSHNSRVHKLQDDIARALDFKFLCDDDDKIRAAELWNFLERKKNLMLILDDIWEGIHLDKVGVCVRANGCKLILTTRFKNVCEKMVCDKKIEVNPLSKEESWELFKDKLGDDLMLSTPEIEEVAKSLVRECAGLPLGIITMARSMKGVDDFFEWRHALDNMKESKPGTDDMEGEVFHVLKHSYDMLKDPAVQQCFLDCSLYPEDWKIEREELISLFVDEGLIDGMKSRQAEFNRGHTILNKLVNACLLENCERYDGKKCVKMHDLVRDMALQITCNDPRFLVEAGKRLRSITNEELWKEDLTKVSLMQNSLMDSLHGIPPTFKPPNCPKLATLLLKRSCLSSLSDDFFLHMKGLVLLDLSHTWIDSLPNSVSELVNLSALLLRECWKLKHIPSLAKLRKLKKLDLYGCSRLGGVPHGLGDLVELRYLNIITESGFTGELMVGVTEKILQLRKLENFGCIFHDLACFNAYATSLEERGPTFYALYSLGQVTSFRCKDLAYPNKVVGLQSLHIHKGNTLLLPKCVERLDITNCTMEEGSLCDVVPLTSVINLRSLHINELDGIEYLFDYSNTNIFRTIEALFVERGPKLVGLISGGQGLMFPHVSFSSLKTLHLDGTGNDVRFGNYRMERLFRNAEFPNLETLWISGFESLVEIISSEFPTEEGGHTKLLELQLGCYAKDVPKDVPVIVILPKLLKLELRYLPALQSILVISDVVQSVKIYRCRMLRRIPMLDREQLPTSLGEVSIDKLTMESLEWDHNNAKDAIKPLEKKNPRKNREAKCGTKSN